ncbi:MULTISPECIES: flagellar basal body L-ring protein FlgH [Nitratireductor]|uniref:flagellar basal body L-ring protein FlgH n=1 Tax=Nitratireductor TaxID=245876 RepID=UPI000D0D78B7|nr:MULTISPECIES: flagellar basal body L-ring protein FlgH [Nitratireductor]PSM18862.1 flagellar basal body L-ring protein [Nitratireductor sp. StC3]
MKRSLPILATGLFLAGCAGELNEIGRAPSLSPVGSGLDPAAGSVQAYPEAPAAPVKRFSLWDDRQSQLYEDARALVVGDILTVFISINDKAILNNESDRSRTTNRTLGLSGGFEAEGVGKSASADLDINSRSTAAGSGATARSENIRLSVAAVVTEVFPNGNLMIRGSQEVRVNAELRILTIAGIVRPADISASNTIPYERIAEARISYGGRGRLTEVQQPPYGHQILDLISPF